MRVTPGPSLPIEFQVLGPVAVRRSGHRGTGALLTQPRHLAVLSYLVLGRPRGLHSRDTLIAMLWPEADQARGRHALRNSLHAIRQALGADVIITAGDGAVGVDSQHIACDALACEEDLRASRVEAALHGYRGELLQGFHVTEAPQFEQWLDTERRRLHGAILDAARQYSRACRERGETTEALKMARRAWALEPNDEPLLRLLMQLLWESGDRGAALREYDAFAERLRGEYDTDPSAESRRLRDSIRNASKHGVSPPNAVAPILPASTDSLPQHGDSGAQIPALPPSYDNARSLSRWWPATLALAALTVVAVLPLTSRSKQQLAGMPPKYAADSALWRRYMQAEALRRNDQDDSAMTAFKRLTEEAPRFAPGWAGYAAALNELGYVLPSRSPLERSRAAAERAMALDSTLTSPYVALAYYEMSGRWDYARARHWLDAGLAVDPDDAELVAGFADWNLYQWRLEDALRWMRRARKLDPLSVHYPRQEARIQYYLHRCKEAARAFKLIALEYRQTPGDDHLYVYRSLKCLGRMDEAVIALRQAFLDFNDTTLARLLDPPLSSERREAAMDAFWRARLNRFLEERQRSFVSALGPAMQYAELGIADSTLMWLDSAFVERSFGLRAAAVDPLFDFLKSDARFERLRERIRSAAPEPSEPPDPRAPTR